MWFSAIFGVWISAILVCTFILLRQIRNDDIANSTLYQFIYGSLRFLALFFIFTIIAGLAIFIYKSIVGDDDDDNTNDKSRKEENKEVEED